MFPIMSLRINSVYMSHKARNVSFWCIDEYVIVIGHKTVRGYGNMKEITSFLEGI